MLKKKSVVSFGLTAAFRLSLVGCAVAAFVSPASFSTELTQADTTRYVVDEGRYIVTFKKGFGAVNSSQANTSRRSHFDVSQAASVLKRAHGRTIHMIEKQGLAAVMLSKAGVDMLANDPSVESITKDPERHLLAQSVPWGYTAVEAPLLSQADTQARKVCVIDTGYSLGHDDLPDENNGVTGQANNSAVGEWFNDGHGHGTHVAGTIAAYDNSIGTVGVYPGVNLHIVKIFNDSGQWTYASDLIAAINQCQAAGANVVNMSLGGSGSSSAESQAMQSFADNGMLLIAAAGNDGNSSKSYPASYNAVMSVAATSSNGTRASFSQYNDQVEIAAPGVSVLSTYPGNRYATMSGTSMATPHVSGVAALVWSFFPQCTNSEVRQALTNSAQDAGAAGRDDYYGFGLVKAREAFDYLTFNRCAADSPEEPEEPPVPPSSGTQEVIADVGADARQWAYFNWDVPAGATSISIKTEGGVGNLTLYVRHGKRAMVNKFDCRSRNSGNDELCEIDAPAEGNWSVGLRSDKAFSGVTLTWEQQ